MSGALFHRPSPVRMVLDTNIVVAGLLWNGPPRRLLEWSVRPDGTAQVEFYSSAALLQELGDTLAYPKFRARIESAGFSVPTLVASYSALIRMVSPNKVPRVVAADADDDHVIAAAVAARADLIVTGDRKHLLNLKRHQGVHIVSASEALRRLLE